MGIFNKKKDDGRAFSSRQISIVIEKQVNNGLYQEVAEFIAQQDRSDSNSLIISNSDYNFIEELDFTENNLITTMKKQLELRNKPKEEKIKSLDASIEKQNKIILGFKKGHLFQLDEQGKEIKDEDGKPKKINLIDEENKLRLLTVLKQHVQDYDDRGAYEIINKEGMREIRFLLVEDFLYPLYRSPNNKTIYPDMVTKKKVYKIEMELARERFEKKTTSKINEFFKNAMPFFVMGLLIINIFWSVNLYSSKSDIEAEIQERTKMYTGMLAKAETECVEANVMSSFYLSQFTKDNAELISYANEQMKLITRKMNESVVNNGGSPSNSLQDIIIESVIDETNN